MSGCLVRSRQVYILSGEGQSTVLKPYGEVKTSFMKLAYGSGKYSTDGHMPSTPSLSLCRGGGKSFIRFRNWKGRSSMKTILAIGKASL